MDLKINNNDLSKLKKFELLTKCKELNISKCSSKNKNEIINAITQYIENNKKNYEQNIINQNIYY